MKRKSLYNRVAALLLVFTLLVSTFPESATYAIPDSDVPIVLGENTSVSVEDDGVSGGTDAGSDVGDNKSTEDPATTDVTSGDAQTSSEGSGAEESTPTEPGTEPNTDGNKTGDSSVSEGKESDTSESGKTDPSQEDSKESKDPESSKNDAEPASDDNSGSTEEDDLPYGDTGFESVLGSDFDSSTGDNGGLSLFAARAATSGTLYTDGTEFSYNQSWRSEFRPYTSYRLKYFNGQPAYCLQAHLGTATSAGYTGTSDLSSYSYYQRNRLKLAVAYGYGGVNDSTLVSLANGWPQYAMLATQEVIWEITEGYSNLSDLFIGPGGKYDSSLAVPVQNCYNYIKQRMASQYTIPSFAVSRPTQTYNDIELKYNGTNYSATVYDSNRVLPNFNSFTFSQSGVSTSRSGYNMTITATADAVKSLTNGVSSRASAGNAIDPDDISAWLLSPSSSANLQKCIALNGWPDPVYAYVRVKVTKTTGDLAIVKTSEDGKVSNVSFTITGPNNYSKTVTTDSNGKISVSDLQPGTYTITENTPDNYVPTSSQTVTLSIGDIKTVTFKNVLKKGAVKITKTAEDGMVEGITFKLTGTSAAGTNVSLTATTGSDGVALIQNVPIGSNYTLEELNTAAKYVVPAIQDGVIVSYGITTEAEFENKLARGAVEVTKTSEDGLVEGIKFRLTGTSTSGESVNMTAITNDKGIATFKDVLIGSNYTVEEVDTANKYVVPEVVSNIKVTLNTTTKVNVHNALKRGNLQITKTAEDGLVEGITFKLTGTSASGSTVSETAVTNGQGVATFKDILIGDNYTVEEVDTANRYVVPPIQEGVTIQLKETTKLSFQNKLARGAVEVTKTSEDGNVEGIKFRLTGTATNGEKVNMTATTNDKGVAAFEDVLIGNDYTVEEIDTAEKYIVPEVVAGVKVKLGETTKVKVHNTLKRGNLEITKTCEDGLVEGITFKLTGTSLSGIAVNETAVTNAQGVATFKNILIGSNYTVEEVDTANRYVVPLIQEGVTIKVQETTKLSFHNKLARGAVEVTKTSEDGDVEGIKFRLTGTAINGEKVNMTATTNDKGVATFEDVLIGNDYTVEEVDTAEKYIVPEVVDGVKVKLNETTKVNMKNVLKRGSLEVTKTSEDGLVEGITFRLTGTSISGAAVDLTAVTNDKGIATFENVLIGENYMLEEVDTDIKYVIPAVQSDLAVTYNTTTKATVENILKKWKVTVVKTDAETGSVPRGDGVFEGAVYGLYKDGELVKKYTIGENGKFTTDEYICGAGYTIQEIQAPVGYLIDPTVYPVGSEAKEYRVEHNTAPEITSVEQIKHGTFSITKLVKGVNGSDPVFEEGAEFQYWLQSAGSYENAKENERGTLISNADGQTGKTISLPYGTYVVRQTKAATGVKLATDFTVLVGETDGEDKPLIVHNEPVTAYLRVVKVDADDGEVIPWGGAKFEIYDPDGNKVTQKVTYPKAETISVFETNDEGYFITPLVLPYGEHYRLVEIEAPKGYKPMDAPLIFDVTPETIKVGPENNIEYVEVIAGDKAVQPTVDSMATGVNDSKELLPLKETTITDKVDCTDVIPGKTYTVKGHLRLYYTGEPLLDKNGERITASKTFKADKDFSGHVEMTFTLDASNLAGEKIVVFQELYRGENLVASHTDIEDADQTVSVVAPEIKTFAKNGAEGTKDSKIVYSDSKASIVDAVSYNGLIPGLEYTLLCNLMDVETGEIFKDADDKEVTATVTFTPEAAEGAVDVTCELNASKAAGKKLVAFETLSYDGEEIASHKDIEDEDQTVEIKNRPRYSHEEPKDNPTTGDTGIGPWAVLFAAAVFVTSGFLMFSYRRRKKDTIQ